MKKNVLFVVLAAVVLLSSCGSKKELLNCQTENKSLTESLQNAKEELAAKNARIASLEEQQRGMQQLLKTSEAKYEKLQESLDKSLTNANQNNISIEKLVDQINESNQYIRHLVEVKSKSDSLNMVLTNNLTRSLSKEEMKEVDVQVLKGVVSTRSTAVLRRPFQRLPRSSRTIRTMMCSSKVIPTMCPFRSRISVTTGISLPSAPLQWYRLCRMTMA